MTTSVTQYCYNLTLSDQSREAEPNSLVTHTPSDSLQFYSSILPIYLTYSYSLVLLSSLFNNFMISLFSWSPDFNPIRIAMSKTYSEVRSQLPGVILEFCDTHGLCHVCDNPLISHCSCFLILFAIRKRTPANPCNWTLNLKSMRIEKWTRQKILMNRV